MRGLAAAACSMAAARSARGNSAVSPPVPLVLQNLSMSDFIYLASQSPHRRQLLDQLGLRHALPVPRPGGRGGARGRGARSAPARRGADPLRGARDGLETRCGHGPPRAPCPAAGPCPVRRHHGGPGPQHPWQARWCGARGPHAGRAGRARAPRAHRRGLPGSPPAPDGAVRVARDFCRADAGADRRLCGHRRTAGQGRGLRHTGAGGSVCATPGGQLFRHHGPAPVRDRTVAARGGLVAITTASPEHPLPQPHHTLPAAMQQDILINWSPQETRVAVVEHGAVQELHIERTLERGLVGNIYLGKVARVLPGMQSAFIDIGLERAAFLHVADLGQPKPDGEAPLFARKGQPQVPIEKQVFDGQALMVQVIKEPIGTKGARLSTQISIAGRLLVFQPQDDHVRMSQKIPGTERDALRARLQALVGDKATGGGGGFILRTNGADSRDAAMAEDIAYLRKTWALIKEAALKLPARSLLHQDLFLLQRVLRDLVGEQTQSIRIDSLEQFQRLHAFGQEFMPAAAGKLQHYKGERPIFDLYAIDEEVAKALGRRVDLKSGGYLIVDQTEALTTTDVNTGGFGGARNFDDTIFKTNLEAAPAIASHLRLRNLSGIIIVEFIDMTHAGQQEAVLG